MQRIIFTTVLMLLISMASGQSLKPVQRADSVRQAPLPSYLLTSGSVAPGWYYQQHFGYFCKKEWAWEKRTGVPLKLRLGNYDYTQKIEGK